MGESALEARLSARARDTKRQREDLMLLRDRLEQLLCTLLGVMPRTDVEALLAGCGSRELIQFGREAVAATVVTALLRDPGCWPGVREAVRRGSRRGHDRGCAPAAREEAAELTEALIARLDFGLGIHRRRLGALDSAREQARGPRGLAGAGGSPPESGSP